MILFITIVFALGLSLVTGMEKNMPYWFGYLLGGMCYTFVHYFYYLVAGYIARQRQRNFLKKTGTGWNDMTSTDDIQRDIERFASGLRQTALLTGNQETKTMYSEFEGLFTEFNEKLRVANEKYTKKPENSTV